MKRASKEEYDWVFRRVLSFGLDDQSSDHHPVLAVQECINLVTLEIKAHFWVFIDDKRPVVLIHGAQFELHRFLECFLN